jgi:hypothetical protein
MMDEKSIRELLEGQLSDVEKEIIYFSVGRSPKQYSFPVGYSQEQYSYRKAFSLLSGSGRNLLICLIEKIDDGSFILSFDWFMLHDSYSNIRRKEEADGASHCLTNMPLEIQNNTWMVRAKLWRDLSSLVPYLRAALAVLDNVCGVLDDLVKRYNIEPGNHEACYLGGMFYQNLRIKYNIYLGRGTNQTHFGAGVQNPSGNGLHGEIYIIRNKRQLSLGINFGMARLLSWYYEIFVRGSYNSLIRYVDAMVVEDDL